MYSWHDLSTLQPTHDLARDGREARGDPLQVHYQPRIEKDTFHSWLRRRLHHSPHHLHHSSQHLHPPPPSAHGASKRPKTPSRGAALSVSPTPCPLTRPRVQPLRSRLRPSALTPGCRLSCALVDSSAVRRCLRTLDARHGPGGGALSSVCTLMCDVPASPPRPRRPVPSSTPSLA